DLVRDDDTQAQLVSRFRREARVTAKIEHGGAPAVYDAAFDTQVDRLYLVMQLVHGMSLSDAMAQHGLRPTAWAASVAAQASTALSYAHAVPVLHRDLKPSNVLIDTAGSVKIIDFGVAAVLRNDVKQVTATGDIVGSKPYMSPEQIQNTLVSPRADLYALGCLLHEMLSGHQPFTAADDVGLVYQHLETPPTPLRQLRADVPEPLEQLVLALLEKRPDDRPATAGDVHDQLVPFLPDTAPGTSRTSAYDPTRPYRNPLPPHRSTEPPQQSGTSQQIPSGSPALSQAEIDATYDHALNLVDQNR